MSNWINRPAGLLVGFHIRPQNKSCVEFRIYTLFPWIFGHSWGQRIHMESPPSSLFQQNLKEEKQRLEALEIRRQVIHRQSRSAYADGVPASITCEWQLATSGLTWLTRLTYYSLGVLWWARFPSSREGICFCESVRNFFVCEWPQYLWSCISWAREPGRVRSPLRLPSPRVTNLVVVICGLHDCTLRY